jgi:hypothetical protein
MHLLNRLGLVTLILECWALTMQFIEFIHEGNKPSDFEATFRSLCIVLVSAMMIVLDWEWTLGFWMKGG